MNPTRSLQVEQLQQWLTEASNAAATSGHLKTGLTTLEYCDDGYRYEVRILKAFRNKPSGNAKKGASQNPFLPFEPEMYVASLESGHVLLLNKFCIVDNHYLIVTPEYEEQETLLAEKEFQAAAEVISAFPQLIFYNSGREAGASQPHRHLQAMPVCDLPISQALRALPDSPEQLKALPFRHLISKIDQRNPEHSAYALYLEMLNQLDLLDFDGQPGPYNLLMTEEWLMIVPRTKGRFEGISVNSLGFVGLLLVKDQEACQKLRDASPSRVLKTVTE
ncbi:phosphorylase [Endozoicomonas sp. OPT23]|uniref:DUF4922 domain-containing protein n=1 Tax=Endozoicomonas sp. OPT23 TaxID=2072845 RepID=UPI00129B473C|nr:DUF4922 domain-containing protein [Endozoicomonas sp. OPT23]MRI34060.1 phosphorylase [Endozoicomonas sp. OPT23]